MRDKYVKKASEYFSKGYACSQSVFLAFADNYDLNMEQAALISSSFGAGMGRLRRTCGTLTGSFMILGLEYGNVDGEDMDSKLNCYDKIQELTQKFESINGTSMCDELISEKATADEIIQRKHHQIVCASLVSSVAGMLYDMLHEDNRI